MLHDLFVIVIKGQAAGQKSVENDSYTPNVDFWDPKLAGLLCAWEEAPTFGSVLLTRQHLWCCIAGGSTKGIHESVLVELSAEAKVCQLDVAELVEEDVL